MKNILSFLGIVLFSHSLNAQSSSPELFPIWGKEQANYEEDSPYLHLIKGKEAYYTILESVEHRSKKYNSSSLIVKYDQELNILKELDLQELCSIESIDFKHIISFRERLYLLFGSHNSASGKNEIFAQELNPEELGVIGHPLNITDILSRGINHEAVSSFPNPDAFRFQFSPDKTKLLIIHQSFDTEGVINGYDFLMVNEKLEKLGNLEFPVTLTQQVQGIYLPQVENSGDFHFLAGPQLGSEKGKLAGIRTPYQLISYTLETNTTRINTLELFGEMLSQIGLAVDSSGTIFISGFYNGDDDEENTSGLFFLKINQTDQGVITQKTIPFSQIKTPASIQQVGEESSKISDLLFANPPVHVKDLLITEDGNLVLVGETFDQKTSMLKANGPFSGRTQAVFGNILAVGLSQQGDLRWTNLVSKNQLVGEKDFALGSFSMWHADNNLFLLFNDNKKNTQPICQGKIFPFHSLMKKKDHTLSLVSIDDEGMSQKSQIDLYPKIETSTKSLLSVSLNENSIVIMDKKRNSIRMGSLVPGSDLAIQKENPAVAIDSMRTQR